MDKINKKLSLKTRDLPTPNIKTFADHTPRPHGKQIIYV